MGRRGVGGRGAGRDVTVRGRERWGGVDTETGGGRERKRKEKMRKRDREGEKRGRGLVRRRANRVSDSWQRGQRERKNDTNRTVFWA